MEGEKKGLQQQTLVTFTCKTLQDYLPNQTIKKGVGKDTCRRITFLMHLFSVLALTLLLLLTHLNVIYGCGVDLRKT